MGDAEKTTINFKEIGSPKAKLPGSYWDCKKDPEYKTLSVKGSIFVGPKLILKRESLNGVNSLSSTSQDQHPEVNISMAQGNQARSQAGRITW